MDSTPIFDVDSHLVDADEEMWSEHFTGSAARYAPRVVDHDGVHRLEVGGMVLPNPEGPGRGSPLGIGAADHSAGLAERVAFMEKLNVVTAFLLPGFVGLAASTAPDRDAARAMARAHNDLVADQARRAEQIEFVPVVLLDDPEWTVAELRERSRETRLRAVVARPTTREVRPFRAGSADPVLRHLIDEGIALVVHGATGYHQRSPMADHFDDYRFTHVFSHPFEQMTALADLLGSGALGDGLRCAIVEAGCGWVPWFLDRLQEHFDETGGCARLDIDVRETVQDRLLVSIEPGEVGIGEVMNRYGEGLLAFGSDYPHWDAARPDDVLGLDAELGAGRAERILHGNAEAFFAAR